MDPLEPKPEAAAPAPEPSPPGEPASSGKRPRRETVWETVRSLLTVLIAVFFIRTFVTEATVIPTGSM